MKRLSILGSTGSIGTQTLDIVKRFPEEFRITALSANRNIRLLKEQIREFKPYIVSVGSESAEKLAKDVDIPVFKGEKGLIKVATHEKADTVVTSVVGSAGLIPTIEAIRAGKNIAIANKETLVTGGEIVMDEARKNKVSIMPVDSEHSAIFQALNGENRKEVKKIILTCSGGPFIGKKQDDLRDVRVEQALDHPTWNMGGKITIDSATLMNKGFEVIEAHYLFEVSYEQIEVVVHPQSIIHSMVEFVDGSIIAQLGNHDMRIPILYALSYPKRLKLGLPSLDLTNIDKLTFLRPDLETFRCLVYAYEAGKISGTMPCVLNAANEVAVEHFLKGKIRFLDIPYLIRKMMDSHRPIKRPTIDDIIRIDRDIKDKARSVVCSR